MSFVGFVKKGTTEHLVASTVYGVCSTAAGTAAKVVELDNFDALKRGITIHVKFMYTNTASNPTLNVNGTGAKALYAYGTTRPGTTVATSWPAEAILTLTYDGASWRMNDSARNVLDASNSAESGLASRISTLETNAVRVTSQSFTTAQKKLARQNIESAFAPLKFTSVSVAASAWSTTGGTTDFKYRASVACSGVTTAMFAEVVFAQAQAESGDYSPYCQTYSGGVYIYSSKNVAITIPAIIVHRWDS